ncbi:uncharacterized protein ACRADG_010293 [Cochliomyia hominivorax]
MKFLSRSTLGVVIGGINIFFFAIIIIVIINLISDISDLSTEKDLQSDANDFLTTSATLLYILLIYCIVSLITSIFLVLGIIKERYKYMKPWICSAIVGIGLYILRLVITIFVGFTTGISFGSIVGTLFVGLLTLGLQILIFYPIYTLYTDIRDASIIREQTGLTNLAQNPPSYGELEKGGEMYN